MGKKIRYALGAIAGTAAAWILAVKPRIWNKPDMTEIRRYDYAKKGFFRVSKGVPENSLAAFRSAVEHGYGIALDVRLSRDGIPVVFGDDLLKGMTGARGNVENSTWMELKELKLEGTEERIPNLDQVLQLVDGQVPVLVNLISADHNAESLADQACDLLDDYEGVFAVESADPCVLRWFKKQRPEYIRGQLLDPEYRSGSTWKHRIRDFLCAALLLNWLSEPDYVSTRVGSCCNPSAWICRNVYRLPGMVWDVANDEEYEVVKTKGSIVVFEGIEP
ncbi:MAG: glycerophosphodiester phosphodiesterase family protein [Eubacteriales bacterium]|nr:glycerophosphodiester phosphodiesterase family protein [Eubacteriales bacterium]